MTIAGLKRSTVMVPCRGCGKDRPITVNAKHHSDNLGRAAESVCRSCARGEPAPTICRHCRKRRVSRPRGLCFGCYYRPGVRDLYPSTSLFSPRVHGSVAGDLSPPAEPTFTRPGSEERIAVYESRVDRGEYVFHPDDARA